MSKWTPGKWELGDEWQEPNGGVSILSGNAHIADVYAGHHPSDEVTKEIGRANARLIAAAPEMADELKRLADLIDSAIESGVSIPGLATTNRARALLAKVNG